MSEQICESDDRLEHPAVLRLRKSHSGNKRQMHRFASAGLPQKRRAALTKSLVILAVNGERPIAELHLAKIDHAVIAVNQQIYLRPVALATSSTPCANSADNAQS